MQSISYILDGVLCIHSFPIRDNEFILHCYRFLILSSQQKPIIYQFNETLSSQPVGLKNCAKFQFTSVLYVCIPYVLLSTQNKFNGRSVSESKIATLLLLVNVWYTTRKSTRFALILTYELVRRFSFYKLCVCSIHRQLRTATKQDQSTAH